MLERSDQKEIMDTVDLPLETQRMVMRRLSWFNRMFLNNWLVYRFVGHLVGQRTAVSVLDVGTGIGDLPLYLLNKFNIRGVKMSVVGIDTSQRMIALATEEFRHVPGARALCVPLAEVSDDFDIVVSSQVLHHLSPNEALNFFISAYARAKIGIVVSDLIRSRLVHKLVRFVMLVTFTDKYNSHDGPLSVLRSYSDAEITNILQQAGIADFKIHNYLVRKIIVIRKRKLL